MIIFNYETLIDPMLRDIRKFTPGFTGMKAGEKVIDVCCGTGAQVLEYVQNGIIAVGIDNSRDMIKTAKRNRKRQKAINASFQLADASNLPFTDAYFDYATISFGLHDKENQLRYQIVFEMKRVVKKDGYLIFIDFQVPLPRNIWGVFAKGIEFLAGGSHYRGFKDYCARGGLDDVLRYHNLDKAYRAYSKSGLIALVKVFNK